MIGKMILFNFLLLFTHAEAQVEAEFELPIYVNKSEALLVFDATNISQSVQMTVTMTEKESGDPVGSSMSHTITANGQSALEIDISEWSDGVYVATITSPGMTSHVRYLRTYTVASPEETDDMISVTSMTTLFVDDYYFAAKEGLKTQVIPANVYPVTNRMIRAGWPQLSGSKKLAINSSGLFEVQFQDKNKSSLGNNYVASSTDLQNWSIEERTINVLGKQYSSVTNSWAFYDPTGEKADYELYDAATHGPVDVSQIHVQYTGSFSGSRTWDGFQVENRSTYPIWRKTETNFLILQSEPLTTDNWDVDPGEYTDWDDTNDNWGDQWLDSEGRYHFSQAQVISRGHPFLVNYDNIQGNRILVNWSTSDGLSWEPAYLVTPKASDEVGMQFYGADIFPAENGRLHLGYLRMYDQLRQQVYMEMMYSRDCMSWNRFADRTRFVSNESIYGWNFGYAGPLSQTPIENDGKSYRLLEGLNAPHMYLSMIGLVDDDELAFFDGDFVTNTWNGGRVFDDTYGIQHKFPYWNLFGSTQSIIDYGHDAARTVAVMETRKDGWVAVAPEDESGMFITKRLTGAQQLTLNAKTEQGGQIKVEVLDAAGTELDAYCGTNAAVFTGDSVDQALGWSGGTVTNLPVHEFRLLVTLTDSELFAFNWTTTQSYGINTYWKNNASGGLWNLAANWTAGLPVLGNEARIQGGQPAPRIVSGDTARCSKLLVAWGGSKTNTLTMEDGDLLVDGDAYLGYMTTDSGTFVMSNGTFDCDGSVYVGYNGTGEWIMIGGEAALDDSIWIARNAGASGHLQLDGGTVYAQELNMLTDGGAGSATMDIVSGRLILEGDQTAIVQSYVSNGWITAYGNSNPSRYYVDVDYDGTQTTISVASYGVNTYWMNGTAAGLWNNSANWSAGLPLSGDGARIQSGLPSPRIVTGDIAGCEDLLVAWGNGKTNTLYLEGGSLTVNNLTQLGYGSTDNGMFVMSGGTFVNGSTFIVGASGTGVWGMQSGDAVIGGALSIANGAGSSGHLQLDGGSVSALSLSMLNGGTGSASIDITTGRLILNGDRVSVIQGFISNGWITAYSGTNTSRYYVDVDYDGTQTTVCAASYGVNTYWKNGTVDGLWNNLTNWTAGLPLIGDSARIQSGLPSPRIESGDVVGCEDLLVAWGNGKTNTLYLEGGSLTVNNLTQLGYGATDNGTFVMSGGTLVNGSTFIVGASGTGVWDMQGGAAVISGSLSISNGAGSCGHLQLDGGVVSAASLAMQNSGTGTASMDITGGQLILGGNRVSVVQGFVDDGWITAYSDRYPAHYYVRIDYDGTNTFVSADEF